MTLKFNFFQGTLELLSAEALAFRTFDVNLRMTLTLHRYLTAKKVKAEAERERQATLSVREPGVDIGAVMSIDGPDSVSALGHKDYGGSLGTWR